MKIGFALGVLALALALVAAACGGGQTLTSPSAAVGAVSSGAGRVLSDAASGDVSSPLEVRTLTGLFTDILTGAAASGITMNIEGVGEVAADAAGQFNFESEAPDGLYRATASGPGVISRQTMLMFPGQPPVISLIPSAFNIAAFNEFARGATGEPGVLKRWLSPPALVIETSLLDRDASFDAITGLPNEAAIASEGQLAPADIDALVAQLTSALIRVSNGAFSGFSAVTTQTTAPGAVVTRAAIGAITVARYPSSVSPCGGFAAFGYYEDYRIATSYIFLQSCTTQLAGEVPAELVLTHEIGHALGYGHVLSPVASIMTPTILADVTEFDRQAATVFFSRGPGNRAPDVDPDLPVNAAPSRGFGGRVRTAGPIP